MSLEPLTKKRRAQVDERTRGQEIIALVALVAGGCLLVFLNQWTPRSLGIALAVPCAAFAYLSYRMAVIYGDLALPHRRERAMASAAVLGVLTVTILAVQEAYIRLQGG